MMFRKFSLVLILFVFSTTLFGQQQYADIGDFQLENGQTILDCSVGYRTYGKMNDDKSNIVLFPTYFNGTSADNARALGVNSLIDTSKFYVISIDAIGNGISTSPSNSVKQPRNNFPNFSITDIVKSQYIALTEKLGVNHVYCVIGGSMGSMQAYEWIVAYPDFMDKAVPYVPTPYLTSYDKMLWTVLRNFIEIGEEFNVPEAKISRLLTMMFKLFLSTPEKFNENTPVEKFDSYVSKFEEKTSEVFPPINWKYQLLSMFNHNITKHHNYSKEETAKSVKAKVLAVIGLSDLALNPAPAIEFSKLANSETLLLENNCGHGVVGCELEKVSIAIKKFLEK